MDNPRVPDITAWTNQSVRLLAGDVPPVQAMVELARRVVMDAVDAGWAGPPYDPFELADLLGLEVRGRDEINDARTVASASMRRDAPLSHYISSEQAVAIEYNPTRPRGRLRFSVAHEIAHTFFEDVADTVRHRTGMGAVPSYGGDDAWQVELLCNVAAGELLMPTQTLDGLDDRPFDLPTLMERRIELGVSTEALLRRAVGLTGQAAALIATTPNDAGDSFRVDYVEASRACEAPLHEGDWIEGAEAAVFVNASSIGHIASDALTLGGATTSVQAVGIPPWPNGDRPRVLAILQPVDAERANAPTIRTITGNALAPDAPPPYLIAQIVNDKGHAWGPVGFAGQATKAFPAAAEAYRAWTLEAGNLSLGNLHVAQAGDIWIASLIAQEGYGRSDAPRLRYPALAASLDRLAAYCLEAGLQVYMPPMGTGRAGGDWPLVADEIDRRLCLRGVRTTVCRLAPRSPRRRSAAI
jgi:hypothetical protein